MELLSRLASYCHLSAAFVGLYSSIGSLKQTFRPDLDGVLSRDFSADFMGVAGLGVAPDCCLALAT